MNLRALIVDDEAPARARLRHFLAAEADIELAGECATGRQAVEAIQRDKPDLVFLDVQMPRLNGFEVCAAVTAAGARLPLVIFVTAFDQYALKAFEVHAIDYLLKPFDRERFQLALAHARTQAQRPAAGGLDDRLTALLREMRPAAKTPTRLVIKCDGRVVFVPTANIDWLEADGNYVRLHAGAEAHYFRETLAGVAAQLPADKFLRVSRSAIVNLDRVRELQPKLYGDYTVVLHGGAKLTLGRQFRGKLEQALRRPAAL